MRVVIQRCKKASVSVEGKIISKIKNGFVLFVGFTENDSEEDINYIVRKIINLRVFDDEKHIMNKSILDCKGEILSISQFTLFAEVKKGNRPSYSKALNREKAIPLYDLFNQELNKHAPTKTGIFGADMLVKLENDGPITILIDSKE